MLLNRLFLFVFLILACACNQPPADDKLAPKSTTMNDQVDEYILAHVSNKRFNGTVLLAHKDSILYHRSFGFANRETQHLNADSTIYLIGSVTKPFTAMAVLLLEQQGKLSLEEKLSTYFPSFPRAEEVTIAQLLTHTSGIPDYHQLPDWEAESQSDHITPEITVQNVAQLPYRFEPGSRFRYTNTGYILLGLIVEKASGQTFTDFMQTNLLDPLQLTHTGIITNGHQLPGLANGYSTTPKETVKAKPINYRQPFTSGNMYSTTTDLWKFARAVVDGKLLPPEKTAAIFQSGKGSYGFGWGIRNFENIVGYGHHGAMNGFVGSITYLPDSEHFICFLTNDNNTPRYTLNEDLVHLLLRKKIVLPELEKEWTVTAEALERVEGNYIIKPGDTLHVSKKEKRLFLRETGQREHELFPIGPDKFAFSLFEFHVEFSEEELGKTRHLKFTGKSQLTANRQPEENG